MVWDAQGVVVVIGAIVYGILQIMTLANSQRTKATVNDVAAKQAETAVKLDSIHTATNSNLAEAKQTTAVLAGKLEATVQAQLQTAIDERDAALARTKELEAEVVRRAEAAPPPDQPIGH